MSIKIDLKSCVKQIKLDSSPKPKHIPQSMQKKIIKETNPVRLSLERYAEELSPEEYISARNYLADIEMEQMYRTSAREFFE